MNDKTPILRKFEGALAQLRHAYFRMISGEVKNLSELARGLIHPQIKRLEELYIEIIQTEHRHRNEVARLRVALEKIEVSSTDEQSRITATEALTATYG